MKTTRKTVAVILILAALAAGLDHGTRWWQRRQAGPGVELRPQQLLTVVSCDAIRPRQATEGTKLRFRVLPTTPVASTVRGDAFLEGVMLEATVAHAGYSEQLDRHATVFRFGSLVFPDGRRLCFRGSCFSVDDPQHYREAGILGSFVGMEFGPVGVIVGWLAGNLIPHYAGRTFDPPLSYAVSDVPAGEKLLVKVHYCDFVPFAVNGEGRTTRKPR